MSNVIYIGSVYAQGMPEKMASIGSHVDFPSHNFQMALLEGFSSFYPDMKIITALKSSSFSVTKKLFFKDTKCIVHPQYKDTMMVGTIAIPFVKLLYKYVRVKKYLKQYLQKDEENIVIIYGPHSPFMKPIYDLRNKYRIKTCLIIPDLPEFMSSSTNKVFRFLKSIDAKFIAKTNSAMDCFAPLAPLMRERYSFDGKPWVQVEGVYDNTVQYPDAEKSKCKSILYTGKIDARYGIVDLMDAFQLIEDPNYELWIRGGGSDLYKVQECAEVDKRIKIFPQMAKEDLVKLQKSATLLVNPLKPTELFTKYFFPSKTLEYMGSGTPTLMYKLPCLDNEYDNYLYYFNGDSIESMKNRIVEICEKSSSELYKFGKKAKVFVNDNKNGKVQAKKIVDLLELVKK